MKEPMYPLNGLRFIFRDCQYAYYDLLIYEHYHPNMSKGEREDFKIFWRREHKISMLEERISEEQILSLMTYLKVDEPFLLDKIIHAEKLIYNFYRELYPFRKYFRKQYCYCEFATIFPQCASK